jgi:chemotaxis protein CheD
MNPARTRTIVLGEIHVSDAPDLAISTIVGSCVAACLFDPERRLGGMNHFLLPDGPGLLPAGQDGSRRYGVYLMELLVNGLLEEGATRSNLRAKVFGGAQIRRGLTDAGTLNAEFVEWFLQHEGIPLLGGSLGGDRGRRVQFWPTSGRARQFLCEQIEPVPMQLSAAGQGDVELF